MYAQGIVDQALERSEKQGHKVPHVVVYDNQTAADRGEVAFTEGRDVWWDEAVAPQSSSCQPEWLDAEAPLFKVICSLHCLGIWHHCAFPS